MRLWYSNTLIGSESLAEGRVISGLRLNGSPIVDVAQFFGADFATVYGRGDGPDELGVFVDRFFATEALVLSFITGHRAALPVQADCRLEDNARSMSRVMAGAVRGVRFPERKGLSVRVEYTFTGSRFESEDVPDAPTEGDTLKTYDVALTAGAVSQAIAFASPFASSPRGLPQPALSAPDGGAMFGVQIRESTRTAGGFTVDFDAAVPASGYRLTGIAVL